MPRDPRVTEQEAADLLARILEDDGPSIPFVFSLVTDGTLDARGTASGGLSGIDPVDFIPVNLDVRATYTFLSIADPSTELTIIDGQGYPQFFVDGNDLGVESDGTDTIIDFRPDATGLYYLAVSFGNRGVAKQYAVEAGLTFDAPTPVGNFPPVAAADAALSGSFEVIRIPVLENDFDQNRPDVLRFEGLAGQPDNGVAAVVDGAILYRSDRGFTGVDSFEYRIGDGRGAIDTGRVFVAVEAGETLGGVTRAQAQLVAYLFEAGLNRDGDVAIAGLNFWIDRLAAGASEKDLANAFLASAEFEAAFGDPFDASDPRFLNNRALVEQLFLNVLDRPGATAGVDFWTGRVAAPDFDRADLLLAFAASAENIAGSPEVALIAFDANGPFDWVLG